MADWRAEARRIAVENNVDPDLFERLVQQESRFNPSARSPVGAQGLTQLMPATARELGVDPNDPMQNLQGGARYLKQQLDRFGEVPMALAAYNAGPTRVAKLGRIPNIRETQNYVQAIMGGGGADMVGGGDGGDRLMDGYVNNAQPRGLLEMLGIQKRDEAAGGETALPFYQRGSFKDTMGNLAVGLNSLRLNPDPNLAARVGAGQERRQEAAKANRTVDFLSKQQNSDIYIQMLNAGASPSSVLTQYQSDLQAAAKSKQPKPVEYKEVNGKIVSIDPNTGIVTDVYGSGSLTPDQLSTANALRDDLRGELGSFNLVRSGYQTIQDLYENSGSVSDYALAVGFAKILDPTSVAREGEVSAIAGSGSIDAGLRAQLTNALNGTGSLPPQVREEIARIAAQKYAREAEKAKGTLDRYKFAAEQANVPFEQVWLGGDIAPATEVQPQGAPSLPTGSIQVGSQIFTQAQLDAAWPNMSPAARQAVVAQIGVQP